MPLIILHGGPSGGFDYLLNYHELSDDGRMVIFLRSIWLWSFDAFSAGGCLILDNRTLSSATSPLISHLNIGQRYSLPRTFPGRYAGSRARLHATEGLSGVIYASAPASIPLWQSEVLRLLKELHGWR